jgi:hypothetical protein
MQRSQCVGESQGARQPLGLLQQQRRQAAGSAAAGIHNKPASAAGRGPPPPAASCSQQTAPKQLSNAAAVPYPDVAAVEEAHLR